jgi:hypothetical protein
MPPVCYEEECCLLEFMQFLEGLGPLIPVQAAFAALPFNVSRNRVHPRDMHCGAWSISAEGEAGFWGLRAAEEARVLYVCGLGPHWEGEDYTTGLD